MSERKKISVLIPCYNEEENVVPMSEAIRQVFANDLPEYDWELIFIDNDSKDNTRPLLEEICRRDKHIKSIWNAKNFGQFNSPYHGICQTTGDCTVSMCCDFQDPVELIPTYVHEWEKGYKIVIGIKTSSKENKLIRFLRTCYYKTIKKFSNVEQIEHFTGSGLYDRSFVDVLRRLDDPSPFLRGIVAELGFQRKEIPYEQPKRRAGKTHNNFRTLYDAAMLSFTSYTKIGVRVATVGGALLTGASLLGALICLIWKLTHWASFTGFGWPILLAVCLFGSLSIFFIGLIGEYVLNINTKVMKRPLVVEARRINFDE